MPDFYLSDLADPQSILVWYNRLPPKSLEKNPEPDYREHNGFINLINEIAVHPKSKILPMQNSIGGVFISVPKKDAINIRYNFESKTLELLYMSNKKGTIHHFKGSPMELKKEFYFLIDLFIKNHKRLGI